MNGKPRLIAGPKLSYKYQGSSSLFSSRPQTLTYFNLNFKVLLFCAMAAKSKILVIGGTGYIGKFIVKASAETGHPTFVLVRDNTLSHPEKSKLVESFKSFGVTLLYVCAFHLQFIFSFHKRKEKYIQYYFKFQSNFFYISLWFCRVILLIMTALLRQSSKLML